MSVAIDSWALKLSRVSAYTTLPGSWFQRRMACVKNDVLYTVVLVCHTRNRNDWALVQREVRLRWYIITVSAYARLPCSVCHWSCCSMAVTLLVRWLSPVANLAARRCTASTLFMFFLFTGAPYARCIFYGRSY